MSVREISSMTEQEKLQTLELIWESLDPKSKVDAPEWHTKELEERLKKFENGETSDIPFDEFVLKHS